MVFGVLMLEITCICTLFAEGFFSMLFARCLSIIAWSLISVPLNSAILNIKVEENDNNISQINFAVQTLAMFLSSIFCSMVCKLVGFYPIY
mmetsp:Transcript_25500/g.56245  ORF Transcript_25500/g.56245 Transcript_25500/m.56245 type:complete len:91 (+) Transcript_25500:421-693(+)